MRCWRVGARTGGLPRARQPGEAHAQPEEERPHVRGAGGERDGGYDLEGISQAAAYMFAVKDVPVAGSE